MQNELESLVDDYLKWYKSKTSYKELKNAGEIITPFLNHLKDHISIFVETLPDEKIRLSDDGMTINELLMENINLDTATRKSILNRTLKVYGIKLNNDILYIDISNAAEFPQAKHNLIQCILQLYDLSFTSQQRVKSLYQEDVLQLFFDNNFGGNENVKFTGETGISYHFDYSLGATKNRKNTLIKFQYNPQFTDVASQKFIIDDLKHEDNLQRYGTKFVMITGELVESPKVTQAAESIDLNLIYYKDKESLKLLA